MGNWFTGAIRGLVSPLTKSIESFQSGEIGKGLAELLIPGVSVVTSAVETERGESTHIKLSNETINDIADYSIAKSEWLNTPVSESNEDYTRFDLLQDIAVTATTIGVGKVASDVINELSEDELTETVDTVSSIIESSDSIVSALDGDKSEDELINESPVSEVKPFDFVPLVSILGGLGLVRFLLM